MDISLALGGGGSRGNAHIGVIRRLEREGYRIQAVAGTSAGGIIAACYAAGYTPDKMEEIFAALDQTKLFGRSREEGPAVLGLAGASKLLEKYLGERLFDDLSIPCALTAVDVKSGREVVLDEGRVMDAVMATIAIPGIFPPRQIGDYQLVDGGMLDPVPVSVARSLAPRLPVFAVVLTPHVGQEGNLLPLHLPGIPAPIAQSISRLRLAQALNIYIRAVDATDRMLTELRLHFDNPEAVIRPDVGNIGILDTVDVHRVVRLGEKAVDAALTDLKRAVAWPNRLRRRLFPRKHHP